MTSVARLVEAYAEERRISLNGLGNTYRRKAERAGLEPDECYCIGPIKRVPDFAIEIALTSGGINKLEIYRRLRVPEVWLWIDGRISPILAPRGPASDRSSSGPGSTGRRARARSFPSST